MFTLEEKRIGSGETLQIWENVTKRFKTVIIDIFLRVLFRLNKMILILHKTYSVTLYAESPKSLGLIRNP